MPLLPSLSHSKQTRQQFLDHAPESFATLRVLPRDPLAALHAERHPHRRHVGQAEAAQSSLAQARGLPLELIDQLIGVGTRSVQNPALRSNGP